MRCTRLTASLLGTCLALTLQQAGAQTSKSSQAEAGGVTREQAKKERDEFLRTHSWDKVNSVWTVKENVKPPPGVKSREEIRAEAEDFVSRHRWDEQAGTWKTNDGPPRDLSTMTTEQRRLETQRFVDTHRWDEQGQAWVETGQRAGK
ncbi:hypothetical protein [Caldimonas brevitalea]|uniref:Uncharacterized protein n=1 Tax=Caldimonas brevitalea TaxID=413882 RepID=A0A0G3BS42_9BURK|nr:hypothetical protein [Caldimonas brevitalea]AKJ30768.1 hypothetical protein AAW51_4077 [Caldimonas brevitalea]